MREIIECSCTSSRYENRVENPYWELYVPEVSDDVKVNFCPKCGDQLNHDGTVIPHHELKRKAEAMDYRAFVLIDNKYIEIELTPNGIKPPQCKTYWNFSREGTP